MDCIELIANQIAISSHFQELINESRSDYLLEPTDELTTKIGELQRLNDKAIQIRRVAMENLLESFKDSDKKMRCLAKHSIGAWEYALECSQANPESIAMGELQLDAYYQMLQIISMFLWIEPQVCGRCLQDILLTKDTNNVFRMRKETPSDAWQNGGETTDGSAQ